MSFPVGDAGSDVVSLTADLIKLRFTAFGILVKGRRDVDDWSTMGFAIRRLHAVN